MLIVLYNLDWKCQSCTTWTRSMIWWSRRVLPSMSLTTRPSWWREMLLSVRRRETSPSLLQPWPVQLKTPTICWRRELRSHQSIRMVKCHLWRSGPILSRTTGSSSSWSSLMSPWSSFFPTNLMTTNNSLSALPPQPRTVSCSFSLQRQDSRSEPCLSPRKKTSPGSSRRQVSLPYPTLFRSRLQRQSSWSLTLPFPRN